MSQAALPLSGVRVVEFTHAVMGPVAGLVLADMGAEVIRVEPAPYGDGTRRLKGFGIGYYTYLNRNKKSLAVNVKTDEGYEIVSRLLASADVLIENFGPGTMDRLGLGYEGLSERNPRLIYCSLKGFMQGPYENRTALDEVVQMMSGLAYMTGPPGQPLRAGASIVDIMGGTYGALGILVALRERDQTGEGSLVRNGLFETAAFIMGQHMAYAAIKQEKVPPMPARVSAWAVYRLFETADDEQVFIGITSDKHWAAFCKEFEQPDLYDDERLATNNLRIEHRDLLLPELEDMFSEMTREEIVARAEQAGIPFSPIAVPEDLFDDPQLNQGESLVEVELPDGRSAKLPRLPVSIDDERFDLYAEAPAIGEHTAALLRDMSYEEDTIQTLHDEEIVMVQQLA